MRQHNLYRQISNGVATRRLDQHFSADDVNQSLGNILGKSKGFLTKHCVGNSGGYSEMFVRVRKGVYKLNPLYH
jgi:hypothetical protein